jgi:predicted dehydrogenase
VSLRAAVIGYGLAGRVFHAPLIAAVEGLEVGVIVTGDAERAAQAASAHPTATVIPSAEELWRNPGLVDFVVVATPNRAHVPLALAAINDGLPVVVDKPLASSTADIERLLEQRTRSGVPLTVFQNRRWDTDLLTLQRLIEEGSLGEVQRFESRFERPPSAVVPAAAAWRDLGDPAEGGGLLFDLGSHLIDQALVLFGSPTHVYAEVERRAPGAAVDDDTFVGLRFGSGVRAHLWMSKVAPSPGPRLRVTGTRGTYEHPGLDPQEGALAAGGRPGDASWGVGPEGEWGRLTVAGEAAAPAHEVPPVPGAYEQFYLQLRDALDTGSPLPVDPHDALSTQLVIDAARLSAARNQVIPFDEEQR